jgi:hypothetical protein
LITSCHVSDKPNRVAFQGCTVRCHNIYDHVIDGKVVLPATAILESCIYSIFSIVQHDVGSRSQNASLSAFTVYKPSILIGKELDDHLEVAIELNKVSVLIRDSKVSDSKMDGSISSKITKKPVSMKDRLYRQFVNAAAQVLHLGVDPDLTKPAISRIEAKTQLSEGFIIQPAVSDAATHLQVAKYGSMITYLRLRSR